MTIDTRFMLSRLDFYIEHLVAYLDEGLPVAVARARAAAVTEAEFADLYPLASCKSDED